MSGSLPEHAREIRRLFLRMHFEARAGHLGSGLSAIDILTYIYGKWIGRGDQFVLSKGHGASSLYATLGHFGRLSEAELSTYYRDGTLFPAHPAPLAHAEIPAATGSLGHGLPIAAGLAFARRHLDDAGPKSSDSSGSRVACLLSDGECNEGSVWEAALFCAHHRLDNLTVIVDANGLQGFGRTEEVLSLEPFCAKWEAFGFATLEVDGHDFDELARAFDAPSPGKPRCILARTIKGKGVSFMEDRLEWHYLPMNEDQYRQALGELRP